MPWLSRFSRPTLACLLLCAGAWVAMPLVSLLLDGDDGKPAEPTRPMLLERRTADPPKHVIREIGPHGAESGGQNLGDTARISVPPAVVEAAPAASVNAAAHPPASMGGDPLPPLPAAFTFRPPPLDPTYRSTLEIPPPPLLDVHAPPPLSVARMQPELRTRGADVRLPAGVPQHYVVQDGDDLTSIALQFYGNPAAAEAIWSANRGRLTDPKILPIGLSLHLPPPGSAGLPSGHRDRLIEPL